jgi:hypothetical protein
MLPFTRSQPPELEAMVKLAEELKNNALAWLRNLHPELLNA